MNPQQNVSLANYSTMGLGGNARYLLEIHSKDELPEACQWASQQQLPVLMIGGGSNIVWRDEGFPGLVIVNKIQGFSIEDGLLDIAAGENWDSVVERSVQAGLTGIEALSLIPGSAGATPIQNVGAYGQEISDSLVAVEAYDTKAGNFVTIKAEDCGFGYRTSRFKTTDRGRFLIVSLMLQLNKGNPAPPFYTTVQKYFDEHQIDQYTPAVLRGAVVDIRTKKLPDPAKVHNTGSFFANPIIDKTSLQKLQKDYPDLPNWQTADPERVKVPAAWLMDRAGWKAIHDDETGMATWPSQPLVLVNEHAKSTADLLTFKQKIIDSVRAKFGITLEQEPELLP